MPQLTQRDTFRQGTAQPAQVSLNQFGNPVPNLDMFNTTGGIAFPMLPLTPTEMGGLPEGGRPGPRPSMPLDRMANPFSWGSTNELPGFRGPLEWF